MIVKGEVLLRKVNLFVDMDGVLAEQSNDLKYYMYDEHFFLNLPPVEPMIKVVKELTKEDYEVYILSTIIDSEFCEKEKNLWLDEKVPEIKQENRLFVPIGTTKDSFIKEKLDTRDAINVLIDDFTENLITWDFEGALPIKVLNGLNNTYGTWLNNGGLYINAYDNVDLNVEKLKNLINSKLQQ